ncbi:MAG: acetylxylan esterase [Bryobacteraceae bacterium]
MLRPHGEHMKQIARLASIALVAVLGANGQIDTAIVEKYRADLAKQGSDPEMKRQGGTQPQDWLYDLPDGVTTRQVTFYSDGTACYAKLFFPNGFSAKGKTAAVVLGHGYNAISIGIEKYGARFAARGLVAMVIDYRTYGFSSGQITLLEPDTSTDAHPVTEKVMRIRTKRTRLNVVRQAEDYRAAISYIQGEPGVDRDRIGIWGSSNSGALVVTIAGQDARVKAAVAQVIGVGGRNQSGPAAMSPALLQDAIQRARHGQGAEVDGGFSFRTKIDLETNQVQREHRPWAALERIPETTAMLWMPAEKDELAPPRSPSGPAEAAKVFKGTSQVIELPSITHFQAYSNAAFEVGSNLAADWFLKYLAGPLPAPVRIAPPRQSQPVLSLRAAATPFQILSGVTTRDAHYYSEGVLCYGRIFLPVGFVPDGRFPAVVLAPGWGETHAHIDRYAAEFAAKGLVAMTIDYRSWGKSGGYIYAVDRIQQDDRFRFMQQTANIRVRRKRLLPRDQVEDIRNAISYLAGEPGVDGARVGLLGADMAGGHALVVAATDVRVKTIVAMTPVIDGIDVPEKAGRPTAALLEEAIRQSRTGLFAAAGPAPETRVALAEYHPFHVLKQIPPTDAVLFITAEKDSTVDNNRNALAASKVLRGPTEVIAIPRAAHSMAGSAGGDAAKAAAEWFLKHL